jgi:putative transposase
MTSQRERLFEDENFARIAHEDIAFYARKFGMISVAHVIMPDHLHWILHPSPEDFERFVREEQAKGKRSKYGHAPERFYLRKIMEDYKRHTAHMINEGRDAPYAQVWQEGFRDDALRRPDAIRGAVQYVILNPVKAGLAERSEDYPYLAWNADWLT